MATLELPMRAGGPDGEPDGPGAGAASARPAAGLQQEAPYVWQPAGNQRRISLALGVVDRISQEALSGLGAVPKRGAEIGGVLLGSLAEDGTIHITGSVPVFCSHSQGSSYTLNNDEYREFASAVARCAPGAGRPAEAIGFYRSHTREGLGLSMDDLRIFDALFPGEWPVILLVKPSITRVSQGAFFFREDGGVRRDSSYLEFPFRRRELSGADRDDDIGGYETDEDGGQLPPAPEQALARPGEKASQGNTRNGQGQGTAPQALDPMDHSEKTHGRTAEGEANGGILGLSGRRPAKSNDAASPGRGPRDRHGNPQRRWALLPLSFLFLLLGLFLGIQAALSIGPHLGATAANPFSLGLRVSRIGTSPSLELDWNRASAAISGAKDAELFIEDGGVQKRVPLSRDQIINGHVLYPMVGKNVHFRLDVRLGDNAVFSEGIDYHRP